MKRAVLHELSNVIPTHRNDNLLSGWSFGCHLNVWFGLWITINNVMDLVDFLSIKGWEILFNFDDSDVLIPCLEAYRYKFGDCLETLTGLIFMKYLEI